MTWDAQGPTSSGKTSLVAHLAARTGHRFVRINNHEQTDLQEYLGSYVTDEQACSPCCFHARIFASDREPCSLLCWAR